MFHSNFVISLFGIQGIMQGRIQVCADLALAPAPLLTAKSCKFSLFRGYISQFPLNFDTRPPLFANPGYGPVMCTVTAK